MLGALDLSVGTTRPFDAASAWGKFVTWDVDLEPPFRYRASLDEGWAQFGPALDEGRAFDERDRFREGLDILTTRAIRSELATLIEATRAVALPEAAGAREADGLDEVEGLETAEETWIGSVGAWALDSMEVETLAEWLWGSRGLAVWEGLAGVEVGPFLPLTEAFIVGSVDGWSRALVDREYELELAWDALAAAGAARATGSGGPRLR